MADQTSPTPMSPVTFGPTVFPMSPTAEETQPASAEPGVSSSDVGATRIPLIAPNPVLSTSSYECQRSGEQIDPLQTSDPWLSFYSGPGSQQALRDALWGTYGPTTTQLAAMPRTLNLPQSCSHVGDRLQPGGVLTGGQDQSGAPVQQEGGQQSQQPSFVPGQGFSGQNDSGHGVSFGLPPGWDQNLPTVGADGLPFSGPSRSPPPVDPLLTGLMNQQLQLGQAMMEVLRRQQQQQPQQQAQQQQPQVGVQDRERLTSRSRELSGFRDWAEKLGGWLCLIHDRYGPELREALRMEQPIVLQGADQELRARRLFHLIQQAFTGYPKIEHMIRNQIMARGAADANGYELFRLIRREFSIYSRQEALYYRELVLKFTVKKPSIDGLIDVLREIQTEIESFHSMLEASVMARALVDLRINEGDQFLLYLRNLPEKVSEHVQLISGAGTVQQLWRAVTEYYIRSRATGTMERAHAVQGSPIRSKGCFNCGDPGHMQSECPKPKRCKHCGKSGHVASDCWEKHPDKRPSKKDGADPVKKPFPTKGKGKGKGKSKGKGKGKRNKLRELEDGEEWEAEEEGEDPEVDEDQDQVAMMVLARSTESTEGVGASTSEPVVHSVTHPLEYLLSTQGLGKDLKTHWLVDSGATCHIVAEEWLKLYKVKHWYPGSAPILRGAGDHILPTAGMVDLEFKVGKIPVVMQRVVVARIKLNVISCYALSETGWWTKLGGARESILENGQGTTFPLRICERAWWLKVDLIPKSGQNRRSGKATKGPAPMEVDEVKGPPSNPEGEIRETKTTEARSTESTATPHTQYRNDGETANEALAEQARPVSKAGKSRTKGREVMCTQPGSLQSFSYVCRMFRFCGDERVSFPTLSCEDEPDTFEKGKEDDQEDFASFTSEFDTWEVESNSSFVSCESQFLDFDFFSEGPDGDSEAFSEVFEGSETDFASLLAFWRNQEGFPGVSEESERVRMFRGLPKTVDVESDDMEEYTPSIPDQVGPEAEAEGPMVEAGSEVDEPPGELPHYDPEGPHSSDLEDPSPELEGSLLYEHECRGHWPYDRGCDACVQARGRTPARRRKDQESSTCDLAADIMFVGGRHWKVLVLLMIQTGMIGMVVLGGDREKDVKSTVSVLNEIGVGGLSLEVATDNEAYLLNLMQRSLRESNCRGFHWRNISENRPQAKGVERAVGIMKEGLFTNWLALEAHLGMRLALESPLMGYLVGYTYRTFNGFCERKWGGTPLESLREKRGGQIPRTFPFGIMGFVKPVHAQKWQGQRMVLGAYLGARYSTGGGCLVYPVSVDSTGVREVIKGHNFRVRDQSPWYDVNVLFPLLAGAYVDPRSGEQALPPPPVHDPERSVKRPLEDSGGAGAGGEVAGEEGDGDMEVEIPLPDGSLAPEGVGEPMDLDVVLDRVIHHAQNEAMNEFLAGASRCDEVGGEVEAEGQGSSISVQFGGNQIDVQIAEGVCDELTGHPIAHDQVVEGIRTEMVQLETSHHRS